MIDARSGSWHVAYFKPQMNTDKIRICMSRDPYRWMEEDTPELRSWVQAQSKHAMAQISSVPERESIRRRLEELLRTHAIGTITKAGDRYFFLQRLQDQELASLYCQDTLHGAPRLLFDPNELSSERIIAIADIH